MMKTIHKQHLDLADRQELVLPVDARILHLGWQHDQITIWYLCNVYLSDATTLGETRTFVVHGTGMAFEDSGLKYIGTAFSDRGFVWHIFEELKGD